MKINRKIAGFGLASALLTIGYVPAALATSKETSALCANAAPNAIANCRLVVEFYNAFFNRHEISAAERAIGDSYVQHNPDLPNGRKAFVDFFSGYFREHPQSNSKIIHVSASGDLVWLHEHDTDTPNDTGDATVDIFRVRDDRIVEHWDVIQHVPKDSANKNTMF